MFAYCLNSPTNKADALGSKPYDLFDSADEAAIDFAENYNSVSIQDKQEYGSTIFKCTLIRMQLNARSFTVHIGGCPITLRYYIVEIVPETKYYYNTPSIGKNGKSVTPNFWGCGTIVSTIHTHANYDSRYNNDAFSHGFLKDLFWANCFRMNIYVATPIGNLLKYTYSERHNTNRGISVLSSSIPWDPNHPKR